MVLVRILSGVRRSAHPGQKWVWTSAVQIGLTNTTSVHPAELNTFNEVDVTPQPEEVDTTNKCFAASSQRQQCNLKEVGNKGDCFVFDLFKNKISKLGKEISKKDEVISFLTEQLSVKNAFIIPLQNQNQEEEEVRTAIPSIAVWNA